MSLMADAVRAVQRGFCVFPVQPGEKTPHRIYPDKPYTIRWSDLATTDLCRVLEFWSLSPMANVGIAAKPSGLFVVDCDMPKEEFACRGTPYESLHEKWGPLVDGWDVLKEVCARYGGDWEELTDTYQVGTGRGGLHLYYSWPAEVKASQASVVKGLLDVRGNGGDRGGYVLGAGSVTSGGPYRVELDSPVRPAPAWLIELCREKERPAQPKSLFARPRGVGGLSGLIEVVLNAPDGNLQNAFFWAARAACSDGVPEEKAIEELGGAYVTAHGRGGMRQAEATVRSAYRNQQRKEA